MKLIAKKRLFSPNHMKNKFSDKGGKSFFLNYHFREAIFQLKIVAGTLRANVNF